MATQGESNPPLPDLDSTFNGTRTMVISNPRPQTSISNELVHGTNIQNSNMCQQTVVSNAHADISSPQTSIANELVHGTSIQNFNMCQQMVTFTGAIAAFGQNMENSLDKLSKSMDGLVTRVDRLSTSVNGLGTSVDRLGTSVDNVGRLVQSS